MGNASENRTATGGGNGRARADDQASSYPVPVTSPGGSDLSRRPEPREHHQREALLVSAEAEREGGWDEKLERATHRQDVDAEEERTGDCRRLVLAIHQRARGSHADFLDSATSRRVHSSLQLASAQAALVPRTACTTATWCHASVAVPAWPGACAVASALSLRPPTTSQSIKTHRSMLGRDTQKSSSVCNRTSFSKYVVVAKDYSTFLHHHHDPGPLPPLRTFVY